MLERDRHFTLTLTEKSAFMRTVAADFAANTAVRLLQIVCDNFTATFYQANEGCGKSAAKFDSLL